MSNSNSSSPYPQVSSIIAAPRGIGFAPRQWLKSKRISYMALPLIIMATMTEFIILATGWKYQKVVCLPQGMGVTFFGIGPIGATILAVEMLKLPLAIWTASRRGWQKGFMLVFGLPLICLLTFQLVKDMAVYEMGIAMTPASQMLEKATAEEDKMDQLKGDLAAIEQKKADRDGKLAALGARRAKSQADLEQALKRNEESRLDAISLTAYQKQELSDVDSRQATLIKQFDADAAQITKAIADLNARRAAEMARAAEWNAAEARIDNAYKLKLADYTNKRAAYAKEKAHYDQANIIKREFMKEPVDPGVPPVRETNPVLKPTLLAEIDAQIKTKEAELLAVDTQRRARVAQVEADARALRERFDQRSGARRGETDRKRDELLASQGTLATQWAAEERQINQGYDTVAQKADEIRAALDESSKRAEGFYEAREAAIKTTQVHRIATTVEIIRGLLMGQRPVSIKATAKERGDLYTDQISMVRIWVYPVLAFIVAFLPTLMVEVGFSTIFEREPMRRAYRLGFLGRRLHWLHVRAGHQKILRAERLAREAAGSVAARDRALAGKTAELQAAVGALEAAKAGHVEQLKKQDNEWRAKLLSTTDSLNRVVAEKDALVVLQQSEIERQSQMRPNASSDRLTQLQQELDNQRAAAEAERTALIQEHHKKLMEVTEDSKNQLNHARRQMADAFSVSLTQAQEDARRREAELGRQFVTHARERDARWSQEVQQREEAAKTKLKQREQQLQTQVEVRCNGVQAQAEMELHSRESEFGRQLDAKSREADARLGQELHQQEEHFQSEARQRDAELNAKLDLVRVELHEQIEKELRRREPESFGKARRVLTELVPGVQW